jgi:hypothetical protein
VNVAGNAYVTGSTTSTNFPTANAYQASLSGGSDQDAFVTELNTAGSNLAYSTYLGGGGTDVNPRYPRPRELARAPGRPAPPASPCWLS